MAIAKKPKTTTTDLPKNFFQTTPQKLAILSLCTFGFYQIYWFFEMLRRVDPKSNKYGRAAKSLFGWIFLYELLTKLKMRRAALLAFLYFVACITVRTPGAFWTISLLSFIPLAYVQMQLNKRLSQSVKAPYSRTALAVIVIGGMIVLFSVIGFWTQGNDQPQDNSVGYQTTSHQKKVNQDEQAAQNSTAEQSANASATDTSTTPSVTTSAKSATKATTPSTTSTSKSTAATPTTYPTADPEKIKQYAAGYNANPYPNNPQAISASVGLTNYTCGFTGFYYDIHMLERAKAGTLAGQWELVSGSGVVPPFYGPNFYPGTVKISNTITSYGFNSAAEPYTVRLHITSPNDIYSNPVTIINC